MRNATKSDLKLEQVNLSPYIYIYIYSLGYWIESIEQQQQLVLLLLLEPKTISHFILV